MPLEPCDASPTPHADCALIARQEPTIEDADDDGIVRFFAIGDAGKAFSRDGTQLAASAAFVAALTASVCDASGGCDFGVFLGDNVYERGIESDEERVFFEGFAERYSNGWQLPLVFVLGNHDYDPLVPSQSRARTELSLIADLSEKHSGMVLGRAHFFQFEAGPVELFAWDTNHLVHACDIAIGKSPDCVDGGDTALRAIRESDAPFKIWLGHHPYWSNGTHGNAGDFEDGGFSFWRAGGFAQLIKEHVLGEADLMLSGHDHNLQAFTDPDLRGTALVVSGAGAKSTSLGRIERRNDALECYRIAVAKNPTVEDEKLHAMLRAREPEAVKARPGAPRLRVIANDDTDQSAVTRLTQPEQPRVTFADVGGLTQVKAEIHRRIVLPFQKPSLFERFKKRIGGGVLLYGPPGCGKTLLARATAGECSAAFFAVAISDILDMYIGESEKKLHAIFEQARSKTPSVLFFDELEALAMKRKASRDGVAAKVVSQFLSEMDGFAQNNKGVLILGATNVPWEIDPAFRRPGRFDRVLFVPPPDRDARESIVSIILQGRPVAADVDHQALAHATSGFSGADIGNVVETAADFAIEESIRKGEELPIRGEHIKKALASVRPTTTEWLSSARNFARYANEGGQYDEVLAFLAQHGKA